VCAQLRRAPRRCLGDVVGKGEREGGEPRRGGQGGKPHVANSAARHATDDSPDNCLSFAPKAEQGGGARRQLKAGDVVQDPAADGEAVELTWTWRCRHPRRTSHRWVPTADDSRDARATVIVREVLHLAAAAVRAPRPHQPRRRRCCCRRLCCNDLNGVAAAPRHAPHPPAGAARGTRRRFSPSRAPMDGSRGRQPAVHAWRVHTGGHTPPGARHTEKRAPRPPHRPACPMLHCMGAKPRCTRLLRSRASHERPPTRPRARAPPRGGGPGGSDSGPPEVVVDAATACATSRAAAALSAAAAGGYQSSGRRPVVEAAAETSAMSAEQGCPGAQHCVVRGPAAGAAATACGECAMSLLGANESARS